MGSKAALMLASLAIALELGVGLMVIYALMLSIKALQKYLREP